MLEKTSYILFSFVILAVALLAAPRAALSKDKKFKPDEVVARHLEAIGTSEARSKIQSRVVNGVVEVRFRLGSTGLLNGTSHIISKGNHSAVMMNFSALDYPGEYLAFDGDHVTAGYLKPGVRSPLGDFVYTHQVLMKEGLLGGVLSSAWALLELEERKPKLKTRQKKVDGVQYQELEYQRRKGPRDIKVKLFFDRESFQHVRTEHRLRIPAAMGFNPNESARMRDTIFLLLERFEDFREVDGCTLPHKYTIDFSVEGQGSTFMATWAITANEMVHNQEIEDKYFVSNR